MSENGQQPEVVKEKEDKYHDLRYGIDDIPPWYACIGLGFQSFLTMMGGLLAVPLVVVSALCISSDDNTASGEIVSTTIFVAGVVTLLQSTFGSCLPIVQGGSFAFVAPLFAILALPEYDCTSGLGSAGNETLVNETGALMDPMIWQGRMQVLQGSLMMASILEIFIGFVGGVGLLMRFIGPITIAPTILLIGMSLAHVVQTLCATQWWIAIMTTCLLCLFSQFMNKVSIPGAEYLPGVNGKKRTRFFQMYAVMITIVTSWVICLILTVTDVLPSTPGSWGYEARTDIRIASVYETQWFRFPYPGQFGRMTFNAAGVIGMMIAIIASVLESIGDYHACARICGAPPPPIHAINRGIFTEGIGCLISGLWGTGVGSTSYSENIGAIGLTKVASRRVIQAGACLVVLVGLFGKIGALLGTIPSPVIGGVLLVVMGMICTIGISNLQTVDLNSMRNMFIIGIAFFSGIVVPPWVSTHMQSIDLGNDTVNRSVVILLTTSMTVGAVIAFVLDNAIPGTLEERGMHGYRETAQVEQTTDNGKGAKKTVSYATYDLPFGMSVIRRVACLRYIPISPTYGSKPGDRVNNPATNGHSNEGLDYTETSIP